jgi:hypothetical protein
LAAHRCQQDLYVFKTRLLTRICDTDFDVTALEWRAVQFQCGLKSLESAKFNITKAFGATIDFVLNNTDAGDRTSSEEVLDINGVGIKWKVAKMSGIRGLCWERELFTRRTTI